MKPTQRTLTAPLILVAVTLWSSSVLGEGSGNTSGGTAQPEYSTCMNSTNQPCGGCPCSNADSADNEKKDCLKDEGSQTCKSCSPTGVILSGGESFAIIDDDGPAASPLGASCPSCATTGADIPEDSQLMRLRMTRIWRSLWHNFGSFGKTMYSGYDYWVAANSLNGATLLQVIDPNNSMLGEFLDIGGGTFIPFNSDDHVTQVVETTATHVIFRKLDGRLLRFDWTNYLQNGVLRRARLRYIEDRNGNRINFNYVTPVSNSTPDVLMWTDATDPYGRTFKFSYLAWQGENVLSRVILPDGRAITYSYDVTINPFFAHTVNYGDGIQSTWSFNVGTKLNQRNEALLPADHYRQSILLSHVADGRTRWIKRADGTFLYSRTSSGGAGVFTSLIYHRGETTEVKSGPAKVLLSHRQQRVDGSWEDLTTYEADNRRPVKGQTQPDGRNWKAVRDSSNDRILLKTYPDGSTESFTYNELAQPTSHTHRSGAIELWEYDAKGNLLRHTEAVGAAGVEATETWSYNARGQVVRHTDFNGNQTNYEYAPNGDLKSKALPQSTGQPAGTITYTYDAAGRLANITDPAGRLLSYSYDAAGRLILTTFGDGSTEQMNYGSGEFSARLLSQKDRNGNQTHYSFDATGRVLTTEVQDAATGEILTSTTNTWDGPTGRLMAVDRNGDSTEYTYDYKGRVLTTSVHPNVNQVLTTTNVYDQYHLLSTTDAYGRKTSYTHDPLDRVVTTTVELTPAGATITTRNEYDAQGRQIAFIDGNGIRYEYDYDDRDRKTRERSAVGTPVQAIETYSYDGNNNQLSMTDKNGRIWTRSYTSRNALRTNANPLNQKTTDSYYADGLRESVTNPNGHTTTFVYDTCCGRLSEVIDADGNSIRYEYDANGNGTKVTDQSGRVTAYTYDGLNRQTGMIVDPAGLNLRTTTKYDATPVAIGRKEATTSPAAQVVMTEFDGLGRTATISGNTPPLIYAYDLIENGFLKQIITDGNNNTRSRLIDGADRTMKIIDGLGHAIALTYDNNGNLLTVLDREGRVNRNVYDELNRRTNAITDDGGIAAATQFQYDAVNLLQITDAAGKVTRYNYDLANRREVATYAFGTGEARSWNYRYFPSGQIKQLIKPNGVIVDYVYDNLERLSSRRYSMGHARLGTDTFTYHANSLLKRAEGGLYKTILDRSNLGADYDGANRLVRERQNIGAGAKTVAYVYDPDSLTTQITYPAGSRIQQTYTDRRELFEVKINDQVQASNAYDAAGRRISRAYGNGRVTQWGYDAADRNTRLNHANVQAWDYRYSKEGDALVQDDLTTPVQGEAYAYDGMHRLIDNKRGVVAGNTVPSATIFQGWTLDNVGNWTILNNNGVNETRSHNNHHALTSRSTVPLPQVYDANFNQTDDGSSTFTLVYDANDRLQQVRDRTTGAVLVRYGYDAFGRRVEKSLSTAPGKRGLTSYYYSGDQIIEERNGRDAVQATYTYGTYIDEPLTMDRGGERFYYHSNKQFSTYALTDSTGQIVERYSYTPYGETTTFNSSYQDVRFTSRVGNPFTFTGRELDAETGLMHFRARTYDTVQGRFISRDPFGYTDGLSLYAAYFVPNDLDPFGTFTASGNFTPGCVEVGGHWKLGEKSFETRPIPFFYGTKVWLSGKASGSFDLSGQRCCCKQGGYSYTGSVGLSSKFSIAGNWGYTFERRLGRGTLYANASIYLEGGAGVKGKGNYTIDCNDKFKANATGTGELYAQLGVRGEGDLFLRRSLTPWISDMYRVGVGGSGKLAGKAVYKLACASGTCTVTTKAAWNATFNAYVHVNDWELTASYQFAGGEGDEFTLAVFGDAGLKAAAKGQ